ncbi:MAG: hypothetical protein ACK4MJ_10375 [Hylemonella sp.]
MPPTPDQLQRLVQLNASLKLARDAARAKHRHLKRKSVEAAQAPHENPTAQDMAEVAALEAAAGRAQAELSALVQALFR